MHPRLTTHNQKGFSLIELMIAATIMLIITAAVVSLMKSSMQIATATYEMTDAQENLRISQEYITRDLMNAGDGLKTLTPIRLPLTFITGYLTLTPMPIEAGDTTPTGVRDFGILTSDNSVAGTPVVTGAVPAATYLTSTDRQTILEVDSRYSAISIPSNGFNASGTIVKLPSGTTMTQFTPGEVYFFSSSQGGTFATLTGTAAGSPGPPEVLPTLTFATGGLDTDYHLNDPGTVGTDVNLKVISKNGTVATSLQRMLIIHYYINSNRFLMRRVFGVQGTTFRESIIAEHVLNVQYKYSLETTDASGNVIQPVDSLTTRAMRLGVRAVEVTVTVETPHVLQNNLRTQLTSTTTTSMRNMQFRRANQPSPLPTP